MAKKLAGKATETVRDTGRAATRGATKTVQGAAGAPTELLKVAVQQLLGTVGKRAASAVTDRVTDKVSATARRLNEYADSDRASDRVKTGVTGARKLASGQSPMRAMLSTGFTRLKEKVQDAFSGDGGTGTDLKVTNIVETIDVGVPLDLAYAQWTRFTDFPKFMKKVENVDQRSEEKHEWKAQVFWSHRTWESTILEQVPRERIVWRSKAKKGHVDGAVTFHEIGKSLTRIVLVLEYYPQGLFERTGNLWRAQGRRARLELKHFCRHVMTEAILHPDDVKGWLGEIRDGTVVNDGSTERGNGESEESGTDGDETEQDETEQDETEQDQDEDENEAAAEDEDEAEDARPERKARPRRRRAAPADQGEGAGRTATGTRTRATRSGGRR